MKNKTFTSLASAALLAGIIAPIASPWVAQSSDFGTSVVQASAQTDYIQKYARFAQEQSNKYGIYPSVMLAQAIIEGTYGTSALARAPYDNQFGMKFKEGQDEGVYGYVEMLTWEWDSNAQQSYQILAKFRTYPTVADSFADNGKKLREGPWAGAESYYSGAWLENANSYTDATAALQGKYGFSPIYAATLNNTIATYGLAQYDPQFKTLNQQQQTTVNATVYNTFSGQRHAVSTIPAGTVKTVLRQVTTYNGTQFNEIGNGQWVIASAMTTSSSQPSKPIQANVATVNYVPGYGIAVWTAPNGKTTGKYFGHGTSWKVSAMAEYNGNTWYKVGTNQWINGRYLKLSDTINVPTENINNGNNGNNSGSNTNEEKLPGVITVNYVPGYYVYLRDGKGKMQQQRLIHGSKWKAFSKKTINGKTFYKLGSDKQWIESRYVKF